MSGGLPAIHALMLVRDEADVIDQCVDHLLGWAEGVYVLDTGSTDGTWEIINERALRERRIVAPTRTDELFQTGLRARLLETYRDRFRRGDWIARVDADEFYHTDPREFIRDRVRPHEGGVAMWQYLFVVTRGEARDWRRGRETLADRARPIEFRRRHYLAHPFPEKRLFRFRPSLRWCVDHPDPGNHGPMARERIQVRHYRFRDPPQIRARLRLRHAVAAEAARVGSHWASERLGACLIADDHPDLRFWEPGAALPVHDDWPEPRSHLDTSPTARLRGALHRLGLASVLDRVPQRIASDARFP